MWFKYSIQFPSPSALHAAAEEVYSFEKDLLPESKYDASTSGNGARESVNTKGVASHIRSFVGSSGPTGSSINHSSSRCAEGSAVADSVEESPFDVKLFGGTMYSAKKADNLNAESKSLKTSFIDYADDVLGGSNDDILLLDDEEQDTAIGRSSVDPKNAFSALCHGVAPALASRIAPAIASVGEMHAYQHPPVVASTGQAPHGAGRKRKADEAVLEVQSALAEEGFSAVDGGSLGRVPWLARSAGKRVWGMNSSSTSSASSSASAPLDQRPGVRASPHPATSPPAFAYPSSSSSPLSPTSVRLTLSSLCRGCVDLGRDMDAMLAFIALTQAASSATMNSRAEASDAVAASGYASPPLFTADTPFSPSSSPVTSSIVSVAVCLIGDRVNPDAAVAAVLLVRTRPAGGAPPRSGAGTDSDGGLCATPYLLPLVPDSVLCSVYSETQAQKAGQAACIPRFDRWSCLAFFVALPGLPKLMMDAQASGLHALLRCPITANVRLEGLFDPFVAAYMMSPDTVSASNPRDRTVLPVAIGQSSDCVGFEPIGHAAQTLAGPSLVARGGGAAMGPLVTGTALTSPAGDAADGLSLAALLTAYRVTLPHYLRTSALTGHSVLSHLAQLTAVCDAMGRHLRARGLAEAFMRVEMPLLTVAASVECTGLALDARQLSSMGIQLRSYKTHYEEMIREAAGPAGADLNLNSPKQISELLYETLHIPVPGRALSEGPHNKAAAKKGLGYAPTDEATLSALAEAFPICKAILMWRKLDKAERTFVVGLLGEVVCPDGDPEHRQAKAKAKARAVGANARQATLDASWGADVTGAGIADADASATTSLPYELGPRDAALARAHAQCHVTATGTGRLSSTDPNLQQLPSDDPGQPGSDSPYAGILSCSFRSCFVSSGPECVLLSADYSQIEMRVLAMLSRDKELQGVFKASSTGIGRAKPGGPDPSAGDVYVLMASSAFKVPVASVSPSMRKQAKVASLALIYGEGPQEMARKLQISDGQASQLQHAFRSRFSGVSAWMDAAVRFAGKYGHTLTLSGRRRLNPEARNSTNGNIASYGARKAVNSIVQGSAADLIKVAMVGVDRLLRCGQGRGDGQALVQGRLLLSIHDELLLECPGTGSSDPRVRALAQAVTHVMTVEAPFQLEKVGRAALRLVAPGGVRAGPGLVAVDPLWETYRLDAARLLGMVEGVGATTRPGYRLGDGTGAVPGPAAGEVCTLTAAVPLTVGLEVGKDWGRMTKLTL